MTGLQTPLTLDKYMTSWDDAQLIMQAFSEHYSVTPSQARMLFDVAIQLPSQSVIVELGVCHGRTAAMLAATCWHTGAHYFGVDFFGLDGVRPEDIRKKLDAYYLSGTIIEGNTHDVGREFALTIDLLFIDAGHDANNVRPDLEIWLPLLRPGGTLFMHDYDDPYDPASAHWAVRHYGDLHTTGWQREIRESMLIARKPISNDWKRQAPDRAQEETAAAGSRPCGNQEGV